MDTSKGELLKMNDSGTLEAMPRPEAMKAARNLRKQGYKARIMMIRTGYIVDYWKK